MMEGGGAEKAGGCWKKWAAQESNPALGVGLSEWVQLPAQRRR